MYTYNSTIYITSMKTWELYELLRATSEFYLVQRKRMSHLFLLCSTFEMRILFGRTLIQTSLHFTKLSPRYNHEINQNSLYNAIG